MPASLSSARRRFAAAVAASALSIGLFSIAAPSASAVVPTPAAPACQISAVPGLPLPLSTTSQVGFAPYATLTATDNHGLWAGVRFDGHGVFRVLTWRNGVTTILDTFSYGNAWSSDGVRVIGISAADDIIVDTTSPTIRDDDHEIAYRYRNGKRFSLAHNGSWTSWQATAVSPDGLISGYVRTPTTRLVVAWNQNGAVTTIVGGDVFQPLIDQYDDVIWLQQPPFKPGVVTPDLIRFRTPTKRLGQLIDTLYDVTDWQVGGRWVWGTDIGQNDKESVVTWDMAGAAHSNALPVIARRPQPYSSLLAAAPTRAYIAERSSIGGTGYGFALYDAYGDGHVLPPNLSGLESDLAFFGIANNGTITATGPDGRVYFMNCPLNYAKHNPRGVIYHGAVVGGQTFITGGSFDSDDVAGHDLVYIFDQTTATRRLLATVTADQYDPSFSQAYGISGNHRYRYAFPAVSGRHVYCSYGRNVGYGNQNTLLGCTTVTA